MLVLFVSLLVAEWKLLDAYDAHVTQPRLALQRARYEDTKVELVRRAETKVWSITVDHDALHSKEGLYDPAMRAQEGMCGPTMVRHLRSVAEAVVDGRLISPHKAGCLPCAKTGHEVLDASLLLIDADVDPARRGLHVQERARGNNARLATAEELVAFLIDYPQTNTQTMPIVAEGTDLRLLAPSLLEADKEHEYRLLYSWSWGPRTTIATTIEDSVRLLVIRE